MRNSLVRGALAIIAALLVGSCGGGGAASNNTGGNLLLLPNLNVVFYAGVPATMTIAGGRHPYRVVSSNPGIFPVPDQVSNSTFTVIPSNPGVLDNSVQAGDLPIRSLTVQVTDAENNFQQAIISVAQNFIMGYGLRYTSNCTVETGDPPAACGGGETLVTIEPTFNGALVPNRTLRLDVIRGPLVWLSAPNGTILGPTTTVTSDEMGRTFAIFRTDVGVETQFAIIRLTDVATGQYADQAFVINGLTQSQQELNILPNEFTFKGALQGQCGTGSGSFLVFDGTPPYTAFSTFGEVSLDNSTSDTNPGQFSFDVGNPNICLTDATIVVYDTRNVRGTVTITTEEGETAPPPPPPPPLRAIPTALTLTCSLPSGSFLVAGGSDPTAVINATESDPQLTQTSGTGRSVTVDFVPTGGFGAGTDVGPTITSQVQATDGTAVVVVTVRHPTSCI